MENRPPGVWRTPEATILREIGAIRDHLTSPVGTLAYETDEHLKGRQAEVDNIIGRRDFVDDLDTYTARLVRAGTRFWTAHRRELEKLGTLAERIATGSASKSDRRQVKSLQTKLGIEVVSDASVGDADRLTRLEHKLRAVEDLEKELLTELRRRQRK